MNTYYPRGDKDKQDATTTTHRPYYADYLTQSNTKFSVKD